jgi:hypothetical protein
MKKADRALYDSKAAGKNTFTIHQDKEHEKLLAVVNTKVQQSAQTDT